MDETNANMNEQQKQNAPATADASVDGRPDARNRSAAILELLRILGAVRVQLAGLGMLFLRMDQAHAMGSDALNTYVRGMCQQNLPEAMRQSVRALEDVERYVSALLGTDQLVIAALVRELSDGGEVRLPPPDEQLKDDAARLCIDVNIHEDGSNELVLRFGAETCTEEPEPAPDAPKTRGPVIVGPDGVTPLAGVSSRPIMGVRR